MNALNNSNKRGACNEIETIMVFKNVEVEGSIVIFDISFKDSADLPKIYQLFRVHRKLDSNTYYTINAFNMLLKEKHIDAKELNWQEHKNQLILLQKEKISFFDLETEEVLVNNNGKLVKL